MKDLKQWWRFLPPHFAHSLLPLGLHVSSHTTREKNLQWNTFEWNGLKFRNRLGVAGGLDKNAQHILDWQHLGAGFMEVGTVTPLPQKANAGKIIARDWPNENLWNKMGFPNHGMEEAYFNIAHARHDLKVPLFVNIGKNRTTANEDAQTDYFELAEKLASVADAFVINVSSPNTQGLRDLQTHDYLVQLVQGVIARAQNKPVLVKLSPDLTEEQLKESVTAALEAGAKGFVLTNTTLSRPQDCPFPKEGGLSGKSLKKFSEEKLVQLIKILGPRRNGLLIVSCGGISTSQDVKKRLEMGADLVQVYSAIVFFGLGLFGQIAKDMSDH